MTFEKAVKKLDDGEKEIVSQKGRVMKGAVKNALKEFFEKFPDEQIKTF